MQIKKLIRTIQVNFHYLEETKYAIFGFLHNHFGLVYDYSYSAFSYFDINDALFIDIGANRGQTINAILRSTKKTIIHSFEPNVLLFNKLIKKYHNEHRVTLYNLGLSNNTGKYTLYIPFYKKWMFDGLSSYSISKATDWMKDNFILYDSKHVSIKRTESLVCNLDDLNLTPYLIKIDVQGHILNILKGSENTI